MLEKKTAPLTQIIQEEFSDGIGVKKISSKKKIAPKKKVPTEHWKVCVKVWFDLFAELVPPPPGEQKAVPVFDTIETSQMKNILRDVRSRCEKKNIEWTEENAIKYFEMFLRRAWTDDFTSKNFMLKIISNRRTLIFNNQITPKKNGSKKFSGGSYDRPEPDIKPTNNFGQL